MDNRDFEPGNSRSWPVRCDRHLRLAFRTVELALGSLRGARLRGAPAHYLLSEAPICLCWGLAKTVETRGIARAEVVVDGISLVARTTRHELESSDSHCKARRG